MKNKTFTQKVLEAVKGSNLSTTREVAQLVGRPLVKHVQEPFQYHRKKVSCVLYRLMDQGKVERRVVNGYVTWS